MAAASGAGEWREVANHFQSRAVPVKKAANFYSDTSEKEGV